MQKQNIGKTISPWTIILLIVLALVIFIPAVNEYFSARQDMVRLWHEQGALLSETIFRSADKIAAFDEQAEHMTAQRMQDAAFFIRQIDSINYPATREVRRYARMQAHLLPLFFRQDGSPQVTPRNKRFNYYIQRLRQLFPQIPPGLPFFRIPPDFLNSDERTGIVIRRNNNHGYIVLIRLRPSEKRSVSARRHLKGWLHHLTDKPSIRYIVLLRAGKIFAKSGQSPDSFPPSFQPQPSWTIRKQNDQSIFEYVQGYPAGLQVVIGFASTALDRLQRNLIQRLVISSLFFLLLGSFVVVYLLKKDHYAFLKSRYARVSAYNAAILENMEEGIIVMESDRSLSVMNPAASRMFDLPLSESDAVRIEAFQSRLPAEIVERLKTFSTIEGLPFSLNTPKAETQIEIYAKKVAFDRQDEQDQRHIYIIIFRNISAQTELENFRRRRSKLAAMGELASRVAHEIRNPLNGISVLAQRIQREYKPQQNTEEFENMTRSIRDESNRINEIIEAFLLYARAPKLNLEPLELSKWLQNSTPVFSAMGPLQVQTETDKPCTVLADAAQLKQVLINLIRNALEAGTEQNTVILSLHCSEGEVQIRIEDTGTGIPDSLQDKIFDLYFSTRENGSGLGLSIVEKIISAHNGSVRFESPYRCNEIIQQGTRFEIILPKINE